MMVGPDDLVVYRQSILMAEDGVLDVTGIIQKGSPKVMVQRGDSLPLGVVFPIGLVFSLNTRLKEAEEALLGHLARSEVD